MTSINLSTNKLGGEIDYIKATEVQGDSFNKGNKVIYQGCEMIISKGECCRRAARCAVCACPRSYSVFARAVGGGAIALGGAGAVLPGSARDRRGLRERSRWSLTMWSAVNALLVGVRRKEE